MEVMQKHQSMKSHGNNRCSSREIDLHCVRKSLKMSHLNFSILVFSTNFCPIKIDLSGNTVRQEASGFSKNRQN